MKFVSCVVVFVCCLYETASSARQIVRPKEIVTLVAEPINYAADKNFLDEGSHKKINCKGSQRNQKIEWYDPSGEVVPHNSSRRVFVQEHLAPSLKSKSQTLVLVFSHAAVKDSGVWECRSSGLVQKVPICVLEPATFIETSDEVTIDGGRSITLSCQSRGDPEPKIQWYRHGQLLSDDDNGEKMYMSMKYNHRGFEGLLTIKSVTPEDSGDYLCEAVQEIPDVEDCEYTNSINITLNVNFRPKFDTDLETTFIFAQENESVDLICAPNAYPKPKFRWFREIGEMLTAYSEKQFKVSDDGSQSLLSLVANASTFEQKFKCTAKNEYGEASNSFLLLELTEPAELSTINVSNVTDNMIEFNVTWNMENDLFPVDAFDIQYLEKRSDVAPREVQWKKAKTSAFVLNQPVFEYADLLVPLFNLKEDTKYWVRIRAVNELGEAPWSTPVSASTVAAPEYIEEADYVYGKVAPFEESYGGMFLGFFLTALIVVIAGLCIFLIKKL